MRAVHQDVHRFLCPPCAVQGVPQVTEGGTLIEYVKMLEKLARLKLEIEMVDGSLWTVPVIPIAVNRAVKHSHQFGGDVHRSIVEDTGPLFLEYGFAVVDWARQHINWSDVEPHSTEVQRPTLTDTEKQKAWKTNVRFVR